MGEKIVLFLIILLGIISCTHSQTKSIEYGNNEVTGKYYSIRGIKIYCEVYGSGKPLLMIHGNGGSIKAFKTNIPYFAKNYRVIVADSRAQDK